MPTLDFKGKQHIYAHHLTIPHRPLIPHKDKSINTPPHINTPNTTPDAHSPDHNLIIHGDNLHALKALTPRYAGRVNCIYIDPPYNTGNENWIYNDKVNSPLMRQWAKHNSPVDGEDLERHDKWLCMMWPRLHLLRELLADNGVIFVSIDDNEQHHLRMMMDEIFGVENFIADFVWNSTKSVTNPALVSVSHTYNLAYAKDAVVIGNNRRNFKLPAKLEGFNNPDNDPRGPWKADPFEAGGERPNQMYPITNPNTGEVFYPRAGNCWKNDLARFEELVQDNRIVFGRSGRARPQRKRFLSEAAERGLTPNTWWDDVGTTTSGTNLLKQILGTGAFQNPKPTDLLYRIIQLATDKDSIILDSFAGSGTTAHAVLALNREDGGNRKFILIECEEYADNITAERVRRVINGIPNARDQALQNGLGGSFTYHTLGEPIGIEGMLTGDNLPAYSALAAYLLYTASGASAGAANLTGQNEDGLFHADDRNAYHLLYEPDLEKLCAPDLMLTETRANRIAAAARAQGKRAIVFGPGKYISQRALTQIGVTFCQIPYEMNRHGN